MTKSIYELFEENVKQTPKKAAVVYLDQQVSYEELNRQVLKLSAHRQYCSGCGIREPKK